MTSPPRPTLATEDANGKLKPTVRYPPEVVNTKPADAPAPAPLVLPRNDPAEPLSSRPPSLAGTDNSSDEEDYNWSDEDDLVDEEAKFEAKMGNKPPPTGWGSRRISRLLFSTLIGSTFIVAVIVTAPILLRLFYFDKDKTEHRQYVQDNVEAWLFWAAVNVLLSWYLAAMINIVPVLITFLVNLTWGTVSERLKSKLELYASVKDTVKPVFYAASGWASWTVIFNSIYHLHSTDDQVPSRAPYTFRVSQVIEFLFFFILVLCIQRMLGHLIAFAFHRTAFKDRIEILSTALKVIDHLRLYKPPPPRSRPRSALHTPIFPLSGFSAAHEKQDYFERRAPTPEVPESDVELADDEFGTKKSKRHSKTRSWLAGTFSSHQATLVNHGAGPSRPTSPDSNAAGLPSIHAYPPSSSDLHEKLQRSGASTPLRTSVDGDANVVTQAAKVIKTALLHDARNIAGDDETDPSGGLGWNVTSAHEAKKIARNIYLAFKRDRKRKYLIASDFFPAYPTREEAEEAFKVFDKDNDGDISRAEIKTKVLKVYKERRFLSRSLRDVGQAMKTLDRIILFFALVFLFFVSLQVFSVGIGNSLTSVYSIGIAASFIFKNAASSAFDAVIFLFVTHPFDTGDRVFVDEENMVVKKMGLFATILTRADGTDSYYSNALLFQKFITNVRRSGNMVENLTMQIHWKTPLTKLDALEASLNEWLQTEENRWFSAARTSCVLQKICFQRYLEITICIGHNSNWQDWGLRLQRKTAFYAATQHYCRILGITFYGSSQPVALADKNGDLLPDFEEAMQSGDGSAQLDPAEYKQVEIKPALGFLPPRDKRSQLVRLRKSKRTKLMRGVA